MLKLGQSRILYMHLVPVEGKPRPLTPSYLLTGPSAPAHMRSTITYIFTCYQVLSPLYMQSTLEFQASSVRLEAQLNAQLNAQLSTQRPSLRPAPTLPPHVTLSSHHAGTSSPYVRAYIAHHDVSYYHPDERLISLSISFSLPMFMIAYTRAALKQFRVNM